MSGFGISGLGSGIDWNNYIDSIRSAEENALARTLGRRQTKVAATQTVLSTIKSLAENLKTSVNGFTFAKDFKTKTVSSSDSSVIFGTATLDAINQTNTVRVEQLATNEVWHGTHASTSASVTSSDETLTITVRGQEHVLNVASGTTLQQLANQINAAGIGVTATVFDTGAGTGDTGRLAITDTSSGKYNPDQTPGMNFNLTFSSTLTELTNADFGVSPIVEGMDAQVIINGSGTMYRDTNVINDLLPGVTMNLVSAAPGVDKTLTVGESTSAAADKVTSFLSNYNTLVKEIKKAIQVDLNQTEQRNPTAGNSTLRNVLNQLQSTVSSTVATLPGNISVRALADIGISSIYSQNDSSNNGLLNLDSAKFEAAVSGNFDDVVKFFEGVTEGSARYDGFGQKIRNAMDSILDFTNGALPAAIKAASEEVSNIDSEIQKKLERINTKEELLKARFSRLESTLARLGSQQQSLTASLDAISGSNRSSGRK